jgi:hypothetical protein
MSYIYIIRYNYIYVYIYIDWFDWLIEWLIDLIWFDLIWLLDCLIAWLITYRMYIYIQVSLHIICWRTPRSSHRGSVQGLIPHGRAGSLAAARRQLWEVGEIWGDDLSISWIWQFKCNLTMKNMEIHWGLWPPWNNIQYGFLVAIWDGFWDVLKKVRFGIWSFGQMPGRKWLEKWGHNPVCELQIP